MICCSWKYVRNIYCFIFLNSLHFSSYRLCLIIFISMCFPQVVDVQTDVDHLPTVSVIQALTQLTASLTLLKSEGVIDLRKKVAFRTTAPTLSQSETQELSQGLTPVQFEADGETRPEKSRVHKPGTSGFLHWASVFYIF